jgi:hypothetical protein
MESFRKASNYNADPPWRSTNTDGVQLALNPAEPGRNEVNGRHATQKIHSHSVGLFLECQQYLFLKTSREIRKSWSNAQLLLNMHAHIVLNSYGHVIQGDGRKPSEFYGNDMFCPAGEEEAKACIFVQLSELIENGKDVFAFVQRVDD